jgi:hypothetical protein
MPEAVFEAYVRMCESLFKDDVHTFLANMKGDGYTHDQSSVINGPIRNDKSVYDAAKGHSNAGVRSLAARSPLASHEDLVKMVSDPHPEVRRWAIDNPNMNIDHVKQLRHHQDDSVWKPAVDRYRYHENPNWDGEDDYGGFHNNEQEDLKGSAAWNKLSRD